MIKKVFLITVDDLRADRLGCINKKSKLTSFIDSFAEDSIVFTKAFSTGPRTTMSFPSILYGVYPSEFFLRRKKYSFTNVAQVFQENGFLTASFNSNPHFKMWGYQKGFDYFEDFLYQTGSERKKTVEKTKKKIMKNIRNNKSLSKLLTKGLSLVSSDVSLPYADCFEKNKKCLEWVDKHKEKPFFCWLHYMDPHYPFKPMKKYLDRSFSKRKIARLNRLHSIAERYKSDIKEKERQNLIKLYDAEVKMLDDAFGEFITQLKDRGLYDDSLIVFTSDHGELFGDYGFHGHRSDVLYQKQLHVPLIIKTPKNHASVVRHPVSLIDIPYTLVDFFDSFDNVFEGKNIISDKRDFIFSEGKARVDGSFDDLQTIMVSCQNEKLKYIKDGVYDKKELFNLEDDRLEEHNLYEKNKKVHSSFDWLIKNHISSVEKNVKKDTSIKINELKKIGKI